MKTLALEVRDSGTFIPVGAVQMVPDYSRLLPEPIEAQRYLLRRVGYPLDRPQVILFRLNGDGHAYSDPYSWDTRTMQAAHDYILTNFDKLQDGDVVDVEFIMGETPAPKVSERITSKMEY